MAAGWPVRTLTGLVVAAAVLPPIMGVTHLNWTRDKTAEEFQRIGAALAATAPGDGDPRPVLVTTVPHVGRRGWHQVDDGRWLVARDGGLDDLARRLDDLGVAQFVFVSNEIDLEAGDFEPHYQLEPGDDGFVAVLSADR